MVKGLQSRMYFGGVDIGSTMTKVVLIDADGKILSVIKGATGPEHRRLADEVMNAAMEQANLKLADISYIVATGYGRLNVPFADRQVTEIACHANGVASLFPDARTAIDIGGQDAKCMKINKGKVVDFIMNDKCAAGTGRFLEIIAATLDLKLEDIGKISLQSTKKVQISNMCTIFAQQEVISRLSDGEKPEDVLSGLHDAMAARAVVLARRLKIEPDVVFTGGVAKNVGMVKAMQEGLGCKLLVPGDPLITGALGAAFLAKEYSDKAEKKGLPIPEKPRRLGKATFFE